MTVKPPGMNRYRRCKTLGDEYTNDRILWRIENENLDDYIKDKNTDNEARIVKCYVKRYRRARLTGLQKKYFRRLYATGKLKKRPYSQAWKYKDDIKKLKKWQEEYLFIENLKISSTEELKDIIGKLDSYKKEISKTKYHNLKIKKSFAEMFELADRMQELADAKISYENGDLFFKDEYDQWKTYEEKLIASGYSYDEIINLQNYYDEMIKVDSEKESELRKQIKIANRILNNSGSISDEAIIRDNQKYKIKERDKQPTR